MCPSRSLRFILVFFLFLSRANCCTPFYGLVSQQQQRYLSFQQKGLPKAFTTPFYETFLSDIYTFAQTQFKECNLSTICFTSIQLEDFFLNVHDSGAIDRELADLKTQFPHLPYLSLETSRFKPPEDERLETASKKSLRKTYEELSQGNVTTAAFLPKTAQVLFDPVRYKNVQTYEEHTSHAPTMPALRLLRIVTGMVITLELAEVSRISSIQLLRHAVAWLSNMFRALQMDGCGVEVPVLFTPFYHDEFERLMEYGLHKVSPITEYDVEKLLGDELFPYCDLDAWGKLEILTWEEGTFTGIWTIEQVIFDPHFLSVAAQMIDFRKFDARNYPSYDPNMDSTDGWETEGTGFESEPSYASGESGTENDQGLKKKVRQGGSCFAPHYEYVPRPGTTWEQKCCAAICCNSVLMLQVSLSLNDCCGQCNQGSCDTAGDLSTLATVHLQPYGGDPGGYVPVSL